jgi:hypothetical protein
MAEVDAAWYALRNAVFAEDFAEADALVAARPELLHLLNGIGETVLHFLAVEDDQAGVAWLHARGADINTKNQFGTPVLFEVASLGYRDLFRWLVEKGADARAQDAEGQDLVEHLLEYDKQEMASWVRAQVPGL